MFYTPGVARWAGDAKARLERAALELFLEQGFQETTVPQITARAGLTTRTFFRHFTDKREVLFLHDEEVPALVVRLMQQAPASLTPMSLITEHLLSLAQAAFGEQRNTLRLRKRIIETDLGLRERELRKMATIRQAIASGFVQRGSAPLVAQLAADLAISVLGAALERWLGGENDAPLAHHVAEGLRALDSLIRPGAENQPGC